MGLAGHVFADLIEMQLHCLCVGFGQYQGRARATLWADRTEQIGIVVALVGGQPGTGSFPRPEANLTVLLPDARFVLEPDLHRRSLRQISYVGCERVGEVFLNASITRPSCSGCCGRPEMLEKPSCAR